LAGAVLLGALAGCWAGWNLTFAVLVTLALWLNINVRLFVLAAVSAAVTAWAASPLTHDLGQWLLDEHRLRDLVATHAGGAVGTLLGWDVYTLVGATPIGLGLGVCAAGCVGWLARRDSRRRRLASWLGDDTGGDDAATRLGVLRPYGVVMALVVLPGWIAVTAVVLPHLACEAVVAELTRENQAEVSVGHWEYRLWSGRLRCDDVRFADPARPDFDRLRIDRLTAQLDAADVLRGRLHVQHLRLAGLATDRRRLDRAVSIAADRTMLEHNSAEHKLAKPAESGAELPVNDKAADDQAADDTLVIDVTDAYADWGELETQVQRYGTLCDLLVRCAGYDATSSSGKTCGILSEYVALARVANEPQRCELNRDVTHTSAEQIEIIGLPASWQLGDDAVVRVQRSESDLGGELHVVRLRLTAPECASLELTTELNLNDLAAVRPLWLSLRGVSAARVAAWNIGGVQLAASQGAVDVVAEGWVDREGLNVSLDIVAEQLALSATTLSATTERAKRRPALATAIDVDVLATAVAKTRRLTLNARLDGSWQRPRLVVTPSRLLAELDYELLRAASEQQLTQREVATRPTPEDVGFRAPQQQSPARRPVAGMPVIGKPPTGPPLHGPPVGRPPVNRQTANRPAGPGTARVAIASGPQSGEGLRVEVAQDLGVSVATPSRIYVEDPSQAVITMPTREAPPAGPTLPSPTRESLAPPAQQTTPPLQQASRREPLSPSWLQTGYDLGAQSTPPGRRWAAQQAEDRQQAAKVLWHRSEPDVER
jgi:hypothetical protein